MTNRERLTELSKAIDALSDAANKAWRDTAPFQREQVKVLAKIIIDEKLLAAEWEVISSDSHSISLLAAGGWDNFPELRELLKPDYHEHYNFWDGSATLRFDDGVVTLMLELATATEFVQQHGITLSLEHLTRERGRLAKRLATADELLKGLTT